MKFNWENAGTMLILCKLIDSLPLQSLLFTACHFWLLFALWGGLFQGQWSSTPGYSPARCLATFGEIWVIINLRERMRCPRHLAGRDQSCTGQASTTESHPKCQCCQQGKPCSRCDILNKRPNPRFLFWLWLLFSLVIDNHTKSENWPTFPRSYRVM